MPLFCNEHDAFTSIYITPDGHRLAVISQSSGGPCVGERVDFASSETVYLVTDVRHSISEQQTLLIFTCRPTVPSEPSGEPTDG